MINLKAICAPALLTFGLVMSAGAAFGQAPTAADLIDNNHAFLKVDRTNPNFYIPFADAVAISGTTYAYYNAQNSSGKIAVGMATSTDGVNWTDHGIVLDVGASGSWDANMASFPGIWYDSGTYYLVYEGNGGSGYPGDIGLATSTDGVNFTRQGRILTHNSTGWESSNIGTPSLFKSGSTWYLYYHGYNGTVCQVGVATGTSLTALSKYSSNPIVQNGTDWDAGTVGHRSIVQIGSTYYMTYEGSTAQPFNTAQWSSGFARSTDLLNWTKYVQNYALNQTGNGGGSSGYGNDGPSFMTFSGNNYVYFRNTSGPESRALIANESYGGIEHSYAANGGSGIYHQIGRADSDGWSVNVVQDQAGYMIYGPYATNIETGDNIAVFKMMIDNNTADNYTMVTVDVHDNTTNTVLASRSITRQEWKNTMDYEYFDVPYHLANSGDQIELRIYWTHGAYIRAGLVGSN